MTVLAQNTNGRLLAPGNNKVRRLGQLTSVLEMQKLHGASILVWVAELQRTSLALPHRSVSSLEGMKEAAEGVGSECRRVGFGSLERQANRLVQVIDDPSSSALDEGRVVQLCALASDLHKGIIEELDRKDLFHLWPSETGYYNGEFFGQLIYERFHGARFDLDEAGKCFALNRYTATVFHLMRVIEVGLVRFHENANAEMPKSRNWGSLIKSCQDAKADAGTIDRLRSLKEVWRNPSIHVEERYTQEEAGEIMAATRAFMRGLARTIAPWPPSEQSPSDA